MNNRKRNAAANCFAVAAAVLAVLAVLIAVRFRESRPRILMFSQDAEETVHTVMQAICDGDYETVTENLYGKPSLGLDRSAADPAADLIWDAFVKSQSYEILGESYTAEGGICQKVSFRALEFGSVTENLNQRTQQLLDTRIQEAEDTSVFYDEDGQYLESFVQEAVYEAVKQAIREDARYTEQTITVTLTFSEGRWWVMPDQALLSAISGGISG